MKTPKSVIMAKVQAALLARPFLEHHVNYALSTLSYMSEEAFAALHAAGAYPNSKFERDWASCGVRKTSGHFCRRRLCPFCWTRQILSSFRKAARLMSSARPAILFVHSRELALAELGGVNFREVIGRIHTRTGDYPDSWAQADLTPLPNGRILLRALGLAVLPGPELIHVQDDPASFWPGHLPLPNLPGSVRAVCSVRALPAAAQAYQARCDWMKADPQFVASCVPFLSDKTMRSVRGAFRAPRRRADSSQPRSPDASQHQ